MSWQQQTVALGMGLNVADPAVMVDGGECIFCQNYEVSINGGYQRIDGYTAFDGRLDNALAQAVPGSGPVRGVWLYNDTVFAWRDNAGGTALVMHKATPSGWQALTLTPFIPFNAGTATIADGASINNGSGATATVLRAALSSGDWGGSPQATGRLYVSAVVGTWANGNPIKEGATTKATATGGVTTPTLLPGGVIEAASHNFYGSSQKFRCYGVDGVNPAFEFDGTNYYQLVTSMTQDKPTHLACHGGYLYLAFPGGSLQRSGIGEPGKWVVSLGAAELGIGEDITGLQSMMGDSLLVVGRMRSAVLYGSSTASLQLKPMDDSGGGVARTMQMVGGTAYVLNGNGLSNVSATQAFGDFVSAGVSRKVDRFLDITKAVCAYVVREKAQYRLLMNDGRQITATIIGNKTHFSAQSFPHKFRVACSGRDSASNELAYVGDDAGKVYRMDYGTSFAGQSIASAIRLPFNYLKSPLHKKRFRKLLFEMQAETPVEITVATDFDYGGTLGEVLDANCGGGGAVLGAAVVGTVRLGSALNPSAEINISGVGKNIGVVVFHDSANDRPFALSAIHLQFSVWGVQR